MEYITKKEFAERMGVTTVTVFNWIKSNKNGIRKYAAKNGTSTETVYMDENGHFWPVTLKTLGLAASTILLDGEELIVPTCTLLWETEAPVEQVLAVVTPTKQTYISIRAKSSKSSFKMGESPKRKVVRVIRVGKTWSFIDDEGVRGYVLTSGLTFYDNAPRRYASAIVTVKGKTPSGNYVHFRTAPTTKAMQSRVGYPVGTKIAVLAQEEDWYEVDIAGYHAYMHSKFVTLQEPLLTADMSDISAEAEPGLAQMEP